MATATANAPTTDPGSSTTTQTAGETLGLDRGTVASPTEDNTMHDATATIAPAPQHMLALQRANEVRLARAALKRQVAEGTTAAGDVILACPWEAASMTIAELLLSQRRWGSTRCSRFLAGVGMKETKTVGSMTERQRRALAAMV